LNNAIKKAFKGEPYSVDNRILTADGEERIVHTEAEIIFNEDNIPVYAKGIVQDITERKQAEKALQESEINLLRLYESGMIGVFHYTLDGQITDANGKFLEMVGYTQGLDSW
jgi:PAS domain-containing protein